MGLDLLSSARANGEAVHLNIIQMLLWKLFLQNDRHCNGEQCLFHKIHEQKSTSLQFRQARGG